MALQDVNGAVMAVTVVVMVCVGWEHSGRGALHVSVGVAEGVVWVGKRARFDVGVERHVL